MWLLWTRSPRRSTRRRRSASRSAPTCTSPSSAAARNTTGRPRRRLLWIGRRAPRLQQKQRRLLLQRKAPVPRMSQRCPPALLKRKLPGGGQGAAPPSSGYVYAPAPWGAPRHSACIPSYSCSLEIHTLIHAAWFRPARPAAGRTRCATSQAEGLRRGWRRGGGGGGGPRARGRRR